MGDEPDRTDAGMLLQVMQIYVSIEAARGFLASLPDGLAKADFEAEHPRGSEGWNQWYTMMVFWETIGGLLRHGLLSEELAFDTILDAPPWPKVEQIARDMRAEREDPRELENLEYAFRRAMEFKAAALGRPAPAA
jgi:hypothetical protein